jgi:acetyl-CoA carboxylase biotin carboxylase subunit
MIAKLIVHGVDRTAAVALLGQALARFEVKGIATNIALLRTIAAHPDFIDNKLDTRWLEGVLLPSYATRKDA